MQSFREPYWVYPRWRIIDHIRRIAVTAAVVFAALAVGFAAREPQPDSRVRNAFRRAEQNGWIFVHLEGSPSEIGYQHGYLLAREIDDAKKAIELSLTHESKNWGFFRDAASKVLWPKVPAEYQLEIQGIVEGLHARGVKLAAEAGLP